MDAKNGLSTNILSLDVGTTTIRAIVYDKSANVIGTGTAPVSQFFVIQNAAYDLFELC